MLVFQFTEVCVYNWKSFCLSLEVALNVSGAKNLRTIGPLIIESLWAKKGVLEALSDPLMVQTKI